MLSSFTIALLCGVALAVDNIDDKVEFKNVYNMNGPTLLPHGYPNGEMLKAGGSIAWEVKGDGDDAELFMYQTVGVNIDHYYGATKSDDDSDDTDSKSDEQDDKNEVVVVSPDEARVQVGLCAPDMSAATEADRFMMCTLVEFQKDEKKIFVRNWQKMGDTSYPEISDMTESLDATLWTPYKTEVVNANYEVSTDDGIKVTKVDDSEDYRFGIVTKHVKADWNDLLEVTFYQKLNIKENQAFYETVKDSGIVWQGRQYITAFDQEKLDENADGAVQMAISTVTYGVAKVDETVGKAMWSKDTINPENCIVEKEAASYLAASLGSFALALAVMNF